VGLDDKPTATVLGDVDLTNLPRASSTTFVRADFTPPVPVEQGTRYALVLTDLTRNAIAWDGRLGNRCASRCFLDPCESDNFQELANQDLISKITIATPIPEDRRRRRMARTPFWPRNSARPSRPSLRSTPSSC